MSKSRHNAKQLGFEELPKPNRSQSGKRLLRKKEAKPEVQEIPESGSCCHRCEHWRRPMEKDTFGRCRELVVIQDRVTPLKLNALTGSPYSQPGQFGIPASTVMTIDEVLEFEFEFIHLPTKPWFGDSCSAYADRLEGSEAA